LETVVVLTPPVPESVDQIKIGVIRNTEFVGEVSFDAYMKNRRRAGFLVELIGPFAGQASPGHPVLARPSLGA
jgi:hypothetical protein